MSWSRPWLSSLLFVPLFSVSAAALQWQATTLSFATAPFQRTQEAVFEFKNSGTKPVTIFGLETSCDCLQAVADQKTYPPGATGRIKARFTVGDRLGLYERTIKVLTDEAGDPIRLLMRIEVPEIVSVSPRSVAWKVNGPAEERTVELLAAAGLEIVFTDAEPTNTKFTSRLETIEAGRCYRLHLNVRSTAQPANTAVRIHGRDKSGEAVLVSAYANVQ